MQKTARVKYPLEPTVTILADAMGQPKEALIEKLAVANKKAVEGLVKKLAKELPRPQVRLLKAELNAMARKSWSLNLWGKQTNRQPRHCP